MAKAAMDGAGHGLKGVAKPSARAAKRRNGNATLEGAVDRWWAVLERENPEGLDEAGFIAMHLRIQKVLIPGPLGRGHARHIAQEEWAIHAKGCDVSARPPARPPPGRAAAPVPPAGTDGEPRPDPPR